MNKLTKLDIIKMSSLYNEKKFIKLIEFSKSLFNKNKTESTILVFWGLGLYSLKKYNEAIIIFKEAIQINQDDISAYINLGNTFSEIKDYFNAEIYYKKSLLIDSNDHKTYYNLALIYEKNSKIDNAIDYYQKAILINANYALAYNNLGNLLQSKGQIEEAKVNFKKAIDNDPEYAEAYRHLGRLEKYTKYNSQIKNMEKIFNDLNVSINKKIHIGFALGEAFSNIKDYQQSFYYFKIANKLRREQLIYSIHDDIILSSEIKKVFKNKSLQNIKIKTKHKTTPIFILGMLRSGTTLVEQILSSHKKVFGSGEITIIQELIKKYFPQEKNNKFSNIIDVKSADNFSNLGNEYLNHIKKFSHNHLFVTDKLPFNFMWIGFIILSLPNAKIINCVRNPMDNCLSIYKNYFIKKGNQYAYDLNELGRFYKIYTDMINFWKSIFPNRIYNISYEALVKNQNYETKKLLEKCDLDFDKNCINYHNNKRNVETASSFQVRQPIYNNSVDYWKNYKNQLNELVKILYG